MLQESDIIISIRMNPQTSCKDPQMRSLKKIKDYVFDKNDFHQLSAFWKVFEGKVRHKNEKVAVRVINKKELNQGYPIKVLMREVQISQQVQSENIIKCKEVIESPSSVYLIQELADGGTMTEAFDKGLTNSEGKIFNYVCQLANGFISLINHGVVHRDLRPENLLLVGGILKISNFGLSIFANQETDLTSRAGDMVYMAPQILDGYSRYNYKCDIWSFGVVCYELATGQLPWKKLPKNTEDSLMHIKKICSRGIEFSSHISLDNNLKDLIRGCLVVQEKQRFCWRQVYTHPYFQGKFEFCSDIEFKINPTDDYLISILRTKVNENNGKLASIVEKLPKKITAENFHGFLKSLDQSFALEDSQTLFSSISGKEVSISKKDLIQAFKKHNVIIGIE